jgi:hypothetical protein
MSDPEAPSLNRQLEAFRISSLPPEMYYVPDFISAEEETSILQKARLIFFTCVRIDIAFIHWC